MTQSSDSEPNGSDCFGDALDKLEGGDLPGAVAAYDLILTLNPKSAEAYTLRGFCKLGQRNWNGALSDFNHAIEINPKQTEAYAFRSMAKTDLADLSGAIKDCDQALKLDPNCAAARQSRENARRILANWQALYRNPLEIRPWRGPE